MSEALAGYERRMASGDLGFLNEDDLAAFVSRQRWFGGRSREVTGAHILESAAICPEPPVLAMALVEMRFAAGTHEVYQLLLSLSEDEDPESRGAVAAVDGLVAREALADTGHVQAIVRLMRRSATLPAGEGEVQFRNVAPAHVYGSEAPAVRPIGVEQSNSSFVLDERLILKAYRRLEAGINPELELLRFLTEHGFPNVPELYGWYGYTGPLMEATLGVLQRFVSGGEDGWSLALRSLAEGDADGFEARSERLGHVVGAMHATLASDPVDPAFAPEEPSTEALAILAASIDEEVVELFTNLPDLQVLEPIAGRVEAVRDRLRTLPAVGAGRTIRHHGDLHLGQVIWDGDDWVVIDFEGEPARPLTERRRKRSPLRDVAGILRSFHYAVAARTAGGGPPPPDGWQERMRQAFLRGYLPEVEPVGLLPRARGGTEDLLDIFELEKAVYELRYELGHRPEWVGIAVAGIQDLLDR
jgi:trehalose synthase-fused probable maltokinase